MTAIEHDDAPVLELRSPRVEYSFVLASVPQPGPWAQHGACRTAPQSLFFPERGESVAQAVAICQRCGVQDACREYAVAAGQELLGIWGGTTGRTRRRIRAERAAEAVAPKPKREMTPARALYEVLEQLAQHPNQWAVVQRFETRTSAGSTASLLRTGRRPTPPGSWEFEARRAEDGGSVLYARYLGADVPCEGR